MHITQTIHNIVLYTVPDKNSNSKTNLISAPKTKQIIKNCPTKLHKPKIRVTGNETQLRLVFLDNTHPFDNFYYFCNMLLLVTFNIQFHLS